jgi:hypothetical protein
MFTEKTSIVLSIIVLALLFSYANIVSLPIFIGIFAIILLANIFAKKLVAHYLEISTSVHVWDFRQYWFGETWKFSKPVPIGLILPLFLLIFTYGVVQWLGILATDFEAKLTKLIRKRKPWSYPGLRDLDVALICFAGFMANIVLALIAARFVPQLTELSFLYCLYNLLPIGKLDGFQLFMNNRALYFLTLLIFIVGIFISLII